MIFYTALGFYAGNMLVGLLARYSSLRFGVYHHVMYALVVISALAASIAHFHVGLLLTLAALAMFPWIGARSRLHPILAVVGALGYATTLAFPNMSF